MTEELNWTGRLLPGNRPEPRQCDCGAPASYGRVLGGTVRWFCLTCWVMLGYWKMKE